MECCENLRPSDNHCGKCHETFHGLTLFDRHQNVNYSRKPPVICRDPVRLRLVQDQRGTWYTPEGLKAALAQRERLATARSGGAR